MNHDDIDKGDDAIRISTASRRVRNEFILRNWKNRAIAKLTVKAKSGELSSAHLKSTESVLSMKITAKTAELLRCLMGRDRYETLIGVRIAKTIEESETNG